MRFLLLLLPALLGATDAAPTTTASSALTADDLQNLAACARRCLPQLSTTEMQVVVVAIAHAEADIAEMRKPKPVTVPSHSATSAAVKP